MQFDPATGTVFHTPMHSPGRDELATWARARQSDVDGVPVTKVVVLFLLGRAAAEPHLSTCTKLGLECRAFIDGVETVLVVGAPRSTLVLASE